MSKYDAYTADTAGTKDTIALVNKRLEELSMPRGIESLKDLFWTDLNYNRANRPLAYRDWPDEIKYYLYDEDPLLLFATGSSNNEVEIIYIRLRSDGLPLGHERRIVMKLLNNHPDALFIFSNNTQDRWHFVNIKTDSKSTKRLIFRRITVGPEERLRTASERIALLDLSVMSPNASRLDMIQQHEEAFNVEAVTSKFYQDYRTLFKILQIDLLKQTNDEAWAHDYALQFLNRCMFLYFIQRKGWLGGDKVFLHSFWKSYQHSSHEKDTFFRDWLQVLFFQAFNNKFYHGYTHFPPQIHAILASAPYLNGGLFSENKLDKAHTFTISDARFSQVFGFLERYNFTIAEDSPLDQEVAVDPEMIGRVYENLVNVSTELDERSDAGIFYTPRTEIDLMCRLALVDHLTNHLGPASKSALYDVVFALEPEEKSEADDALAVKNLWGDVYGLLREITIVDPACGSGAFLVGMLAVLDDLQERASHHIHSSDENSYARKKRIIGQSLYGVDAMEWAVHIAELRLWLSLIIDVDMPLEELHVRRDPLLPHLTFKVRCGDSLVQEVGGVNFGHRRSTTELSQNMKLRLETLKREKNKFYNNDPTCDFKTREAAEQDEVRLFRDIIRERKLRVEQELQRLRNPQQSTQLALPGDASMSTMTSGLSEKQRQAETLEKEKQIEEKERERQALDEALNALVSPKQVPFVWDISFVEIFSGVNQGFDIVIGNPPYVRQEQISDPRSSRHESTPDSRRAYKQKLIFTVYREFPDFFNYKPGTQKSGRPIDAKSDLYIYFYLHGLSLLNPKGSFCFITSNSWLDVGYGKDLQEFLLRYCRIRMIIDNRVKRSFSTADINTIIALFSAPGEKPSTSALNNIARFVMFKVSFEQVLEAATFKRIERTQERTVTNEYRIYPIVQRALLEDGYKSFDEMIEESEEDTPKKPTTTLVKEAQAVYGGNKWGGKYLRAPDIYWTILEKGKGKLVRLGDIAEVRFGIKTGANEFFYLDGEKIRQWGIEEEFLQPVIKSPRECKSILIDPSMLKNRLFMCHQSKEELKGTAALRYIEWGEKQKFRSNPSVAGRARWWDLGERRMPPIISPSSISELLRTFRNSGVFADKRLYEIYPSTSIGIDKLLLATNSITSSLFLDIGSRTGLGEGLLDLTVYELADCLVVVPEDLYRVEKALYEASRRDILPLREEIQHPNRREIDSIIFDALNLTQDERDAVYEAVIELVEGRLQKAGSLRVSQEQRKRAEAVEKTLGIWIGLPEIEEEVDGSYA